MNIKEYCQNLHNTKKSFAFIYQIKKDGKESEIIKTTNFLIDKRISTRVYCILHDIIEHPKCECGKQLKFNQYSEGFREFCSVKCSSNSKTKQDRIKETNIKKYGHENAFHSESGRKSWNEFQNDDDRVEIAVNKGKNTLKENYGVDTIEEAEKIRTDVALKAKIEKYGHAFNNRAKANISRDENKMVENLRKTCLEKYGVVNPMHVPEFFNNSLKSTYRLKQYTFPSGRIDKVQGYEPLALDELLNKYDEDEIITDSTLIPKITYNSNDDKEHIYYPDIYIPKDNLIIEVKSDYTMRANYEINKLKEKACLSQGLNFKFMVFDGKGNLLD